MKKFKEYMSLVADKRCPDGYRFDNKLKVCVPTGNKYVRYPFFLSLPYIISLAPLKKFY